MGRKFRSAVAESKAVKSLRERIEQTLRNVTDYVTGALEQLMFQQGQTMTVQAAMLEYLVEQEPFARARIEQIVTESIAKAEAERKAKQEESAKRAAEKEIERATQAAADTSSAPLCPSCGGLSCAPGCTNKPAGAYRSVDDPALYQAPPADIVPVAADGAETG